MLRPQCSPSRNELAITDRRPLIVTDSLPPLDEPPGLCGQQTLPSELGSSSVVDRCRRVPTRCAFRRSSRFGVLYVISRLGMPIYAQVASSRALPLPHHLYCHHTTLLSCVLDLVPHTNPFPRRLASSFTLSQYQRKGVRMIRVGLPPPWRCFSSSLSDIKRMST